MAIPPLEVLFEDNHLLVVNKPAGLATQGAAEGAASVVTVAKAYLKEKFHKPGNVYLGVVSRLDRLVTGVLILARTSKAAARLTEQFRSGSARKVYWALVESPPDEPEAEVVHWIAKDEHRQRMVVTPRGAPGAQKATLSYRVVDGGRRACLVEVHLKTGRKHQIRLQLSALQRPILGDRKYGSRREFPHGIALHARQLTISHPVTKVAHTFVAPLPPSFDNWVGGNSS